MGCCNVTQCEAELLLSPESWHFSYNSLTQSVLFLIPQKFANANIKLKKTLFDITFIVYSYV